MKIENFSSLMGVGVVLFILFSPSPLAASPIPSGALRPLSEQGPGSVQPIDKGDGISWSGKLLASARLYAQTDDLWESYWQTNPRLDMEVESKRERVDWKVRFRLEYGSDLVNQYSTPTLPEFRRVLDEVYVRAFLGPTVLEAGYMKVVWGKGDDVHVIDLLNPTDYYDFVNNNYLDRRIAEWMFRFTLPIGDMHALELAWAPITTPDRIPLEGPWKPSDISALEKTLQLLTGSQNPISATSLMANGKLAQEDLNTLADGTYAVRFTGSSAGFDYGLLYAYTYNRQPRLDLSHFTLQNQKIYLAYDRVHAFGAEGATAWRGFNFRFEGGYFLTTDTGGTDPNRRNNWVGYVVGFDKDLWTDGANLNLQVQGNVPLGIDKIKANPLDTEYRSDGKYTRHILAASLSDAVWENKVKLKLSGAYGIEQRDFRLSPEITFEPFDDFQLTLRWVQYQGKESSTFGQFKDSSFWEVGASYRF